MVREVRIHPRCQTVQTLRSNRSGEQFLPGEALILRNAQLPQTELEDLLVEGSHIHLPLVGFSAETGCDGETMEFIAGDYFGSAHLCWWVDGPPEWREFTHWARKLRAFLERCLER